MASEQILSLCSGIGGLDLGLHAGLRAMGRSPRSVCMVEREAFCCAVLAKQMQAGALDDCPIWCGDLRTLPIDELPQVDWITGGYPCQPFSTAGKRQGEDDPRHLWPVIRDLVESLRPRGVFFENVAGHLSLGLPRVLTDLESLGFRCAFGLYSAAEVGAPHRRERVFILGLADTGRDGAPARRERQTSSEGSRGGDGQGGGGCDARQGHQPSAGEASSVADRDGRGLAELRECDSVPREDGAPLRDDACGCGSPVADPEGEQRGTGPIELDRKESPSCGEELADANSGRGEQGWEPGQQGPAWTLEPSGSSLLADGSGTGLQGRSWDVSGSGRENGGEARPVASAGLSRGARWPARPGRPQFEWEPPRVVEPELRGGPHGVSIRVDRLRALGNAVVPAQAENAFIDLWKALER